LGKKIRKRKLREKRERMRDEGGLQGRKTQKEKERGEIVDLKGNILINASETSLIQGSEGGIQRNREE
jgi:hypothetical protein